MLNKEQTCFPKKKNIVAGFGGDVVVAVAAAAAAVVVVVVAAAAAQKVDAFDFGIEIVLDPFFEKKKEKEKSIFLFVLNFI